MSTEVARRTQTFALVRQLEESGALTPTSLDLSSRPDLSFEQFQALGVFLARLHDGTKFFLGDWILAGEVRFGEEMAQAIAATRRAETTLLNWVWTCRRVPPSRRRENLSFSHHVLVAALQPEEQVEYLDRAEAERWTSRELAAALKARRELGEGERDECGDVVEEAARDLRTRLRMCGLDDTSVFVEISGAGFSYTVRVP